MESQQPTDKTSRRMLWIGIGVVIAVIIVIAAISYAMVANTKKQSATSKASPSASASVATKAEVTQNLETLDQSMTQAKKDQDAAKAAVKASANQTKIGN